MRCLFHWSAESFYGDFEWFILSVHKGLVIASSLKFEFPTRYMHMSSYRIRLQYSDV